MNSRLKQLKPHLVALTVILILTAIVLTYYFTRYYNKIDTTVLSRVELIQQMETVGAQDFPFTALKGESGSLANYKGQLIIINFWASWCAPCIEEIPSLIQLIKKFPGQIRLIAVSGDSSLEDIQTFLKSFPELENIHTDIVWDKEFKTMKLYQVDKLPESFIVGKDFKLVKKIVGTINWYTPDALTYVEGLLKK